MKRLLLIVALVVGLYIYLNPPVSVIVDLPPLPAKVEVIVKPGVSNYELQAVKRSLSLAARLLENEAGLTLQHPVSVVLAPEITAYYKVLTEELGIDKNSALFQAGISAGTTHERQIVINCGAVPNYNDLIFIAAHELTHQYQFESTGEWSRNNWFTEGMAEVVAATVVGDNQGNRGAAAEYRRAWLEQIRKAAPRIPRLEQLDRRHDWVETFYEYHTLNYRCGALAVYALVDKCGFPSLAEYIRLRNRGISAEEAFERTFHKPLPLFFREQDEWLKKEADERHYQLKADMPPEETPARQARAFSD